MRAKISLALMLAGIFCLSALPEAAAGMKSIPPSAACNLLSGIGLPTLGWRTYYDDECGCSSRSKSLGPGNPFKNEMSYYAEGNGQTVKQIKLIMNILNTEAAAVAHAGFEETAHFLIRKLTSKPVTENFSRAIAAGVNQTFLADGFLFELMRKEWKMSSDLGVRQCYEVRLTIR